MAAWWAGSTRLAPLTRGRLAGRSSPMSEIRVPRTVAETVEGVSARPGALSQLAAVVRTRRARLHSSLRRNSGRQDPPDTRWRLAAGVLGALLLGLAVGSVGGKVTA